MKQVIELLSFSETLMSKRLIPRSLKKYIRKEKARIRQVTPDLELQNKLIQELYQKLDLVKPI